ncbi:MAG: Ig-like domain-containing protein [Myxococcota bacterium]
MNLSLLIRPLPTCLAAILAFLMIALAGLPGGAADLQFGVVMPSVSILPLGATFPLTTTGHFTDGTTRRLSHATIAAGGNHACALATNGEVRCWGRGGSGQLGNGISADSSVPVTVAGLVDATDLAAGGDVSCALLADASLRCWGLNTSGQLGNGSTTASSLPVTVPGVTARAISVGFAHACAVRTNGEVACWGANASGQLGDGSFAGSSSPVLVSGITTAVAVAAGGNHTCALLATGEVKCWGAGGSGQLGTGFLASSPTPVDVAFVDDAVAIDAGFDHACALIAGGALQCWGRGNEGQIGNGGFANAANVVNVAIGIERVVALGLGSSHGCAVLDDGFIKCWGRNANGQLGNGTTAGTFPSPAPVVGIATAVAVDAGFEQTCALLADGNTICFGLNDAGQLGTGTAGGANQRSGVPLTVSGPVLAVDAGGNHTCAATPTGLANCWGYGFYGQLGDDDVSDSSVPTTVLRLDNSAGSAAENAVGLALGFDHSCAVLQSGRAKCWGRNNFVQLGINRNSIDVPALTTPDDVYQVSTASRIASGAFHSCIVLQTGAVQCWGGNDFGALGNSDPAYSAFPKTVAGITTATRISAGLNHTCVLLSSGVVQCWGRGDEGQLGNGSFANSSSPVTVAGITTATSIGVGNSHSCARLVGGSVRCWGRNVEGQLGNSSTVGSAVPVVVTGLTSATGVTSGGFHSCVTLSSGGVNCWGRGDLGQLGTGFRFNISAPVVVSGLSGAVAVDAGRSHTCAVQSGGRLRCWGYGEFGQLGHGVSGAGLVADTPVVVSGINMGAAALTWTSADPSIATVDMSGRVHGVGVGTTTISWEYDSRRGFVSVEVPEPGLAVGVFAGGVGLASIARRRRVSEASRAHRGRRRTGGKA